MAFFYTYPPERYPTTYVKESFPESHWPFENPRHKIGHAVHEIFRPLEEIRSPSADIRETMKKYYVDIELPGLASKDDYSLLWTNSRTLLVQAKITPPEIKEATASSQNEGSEVDKSKAANIVHSLARERRTGNFARAFNFAVDVDRSNLNATLQNGLLQVVVQKKESEHNPPQQVDVKHLDS